MGSNGIRLSELITIAGFVAAICSVAAFFLGRRKELKHEAEKEGATDGYLKSNIEYIKRRTDDVLLEQKDTNKSLSALSERVTRVEESTKQAHKRLDKVEVGN